MSFNRKIISTIAIQAIGPFSFFVAIWFLSRSQGAVVQGKFSEIKSLVDLFVSFLTFGLPQSFVYAINKLHIDRGRLIRWSLKYGVACIFISALFVITLRQFAWGPVELVNSDLFVISLLLLSLSGLVISALLRGILLTITDGWQFSFLSIFSTVVLSLFVIILSYVRYFEPVSVFLYSGALSAIVGFWFVRHHFHEIHSVNPLPWPDLVANGGAVFLQGLLTAMQPFITISMIRKFGGGYNEVAFFSLSMYVYQSGIVPLRMVSPILYNRWTKSQSDRHIYADIKKLFLPIIPLALCSIVASFLIKYIIPLAFKSEYLAAIPAIRIMLLAIPILYLGQVGIPIIMSKGMFRMNALIVFAKLVICIFVLCIFSSGSGSISQYAALSWAFAELVAAIIIVYLVLGILKSVNR